MRPGKKSKCYAHELFPKFWPVYFALCLLLTVCQASLTCSSPARFHQVFGFANSSTFLLLRDVIFHKFRKHNLLCKALLGETGLALFRQLAQAVGVTAPVTTLRDPTNLKKRFLLGQASNTGVTHWSEPLAHSVFLAWGKSISRALAP